MRTIRPFLFGFSDVARKKITAAFDSGQINSDGGVMLVAAAERRLGLAECLAGLIADPRNPLFVTHSVADRSPRGPSFALAPLSGVTITHCDC
jgi:hypothetical protein